MFQFHSLPSDVAGIAASILSANPSWNPTQVRNAIVNNAKTLSIGPLATAVACGIVPPTPCPNGMDIEIKITTDEYPEETAWTLTNKCGSGAVINSPQYTATKTLHSNKYCVPTGAYDFTITDEFSDGICCEYGNGSYDVRVNGSSAATGGNLHALRSLPLRVTQLENQHAFQHLSPHYRRPPYYQRTRLIQVAPKELTLRSRLRSGPIGIPKRLLGH